MHCGDPNCGSGNLIANPDADGRFPSLALDSSGNPVVSYGDNNNQALKVLHCGNPNCSDIPVGGIGGLRTDSDAPPDESEPSNGHTVPIVASVALGLLVIGAGGLYAVRMRRR